MTCYVRLPHFIRTRRMFITFLHDPFADYVLSQLNQVHFNVTLPNAAGRTSASESGGLEFKRRTLSRLL